MTGTPLHFDEALVRSLIDSAAEPLILLDEGGGIVFLNAPAAALFDHPSGELRGLNPDAAPSHPRDSGAKPSAFHSQVFTARNVIAFSGHAVTHWPQPWQSSARTAKACL